MKDILSKKKKLGQYEMVSLTEEYSVVLQKKLPHKLKDLGSFTISFTIGSLNINNVFCHLGSSINLISLSMNRKFDIREVQSTTISLQLVDRSF